MPSYTIAQLFVNNPGNLSDNLRRAKLDKMVAEMESLPLAFNTKDGTNYFLSDFIEFEESYQKLFSDEEEEEEEVSFNTKENVEKPLNTINISKLIEPIITTTKSDINSFKYNNKISNQNETFLKINKSTVLKIKRETNYNSVTINIEKNLPLFLESTEYRHWTSFIKYSNITNKQNKISKIHLDKFMILVGYHGDELKDWYFLNNFK